VASSPTREERGHHLPGLLAHAPEQFLGPRLQLPELLARGLRDVLVLLGHLRRVLHRLLDELLRPGQDPLRRFGPLLGVLGRPDLVDGDREPEVVQRVVGQHARGRDLRVRRALPLVRPHGEEQDAEQQREGEQRRLRERGEHASVEALLPEDEERLRGLFRMRVEGPLILPTRDGQRDPGDQ
jgi:hypothetical protein